MEDRASEVFVPPKHVEANLKNPEVKFLDCSWCMPNETKDIYADFRKERIPGAVLFDIDVICDKSVDLPHMLPSKEQFNEEMGKLGISNSDQVILYDTSCSFVASARVWWTFKVFGHDKVKIMEGGLLPYKGQRFPIESGPPTPPKTTVYKARTFMYNLVKNKKDMEDNLRTEEYEVIDARPGPRFYGKAPEPRPGLRSGHIPNSKHVFWNTILNPAMMTLWSHDELMIKFKEANIDFSKPIITTCGSGVTASVLSLGLYCNGIESAVYDGSFSEWGKPDAGTPIATDGK